MFIKIDITNKFLSYFFKSFILFVILINNIGLELLAKEEIIEKYKNKQILNQDNGFLVKVNFNEVLGDEKLLDNLHIIDNELIYSSKIVNRVNKYYSNKIKFIKNIDHSLKFETLKLDFISNFNEIPEVKLKLNKIDTINISFSNDESKINSNLDNYSYLNFYNLNQFNNDKENKFININLISKIIRNNKIYSVKFSPINYLSHNKKYITVEFYSDFEIIIDYKNKINNQTKINNRIDKVSNKELSFLPNLVNNQHLEFFINNNDYLLSKYNKNNLIQSNLEWYDKNKDYYEIIVEKNGIVRTKISELLKLENSLLNKNYKNLELVSNGKSYPFYYKSNDEVVSAEDEIFFYGLKAIGDTTLNDFYTNKQSYYLHYGNKPNNNLLKLKEFRKTSNLTPNSNSFYSEIRIEKDSLFGHGNDFSSVNHSFGEFWYWNILTTLNTYSKFNETITFYPDYESNEKPFFGIEYKNFSYINRDIYNSEFVKTFIYNNIKSKLNNQTFVDTMFTGLTYDTLKNEANHINLNFGENKINLEIFKTLEDSAYLNNNNKNIFNIDAIIGVDALLYKGYIKPIAINSSLMSNKIEQGFENNFNIYGFKDQEVVYIDTLNKEIAFPKSQKGYLLKSNIHSDLIEISIEGIEDNFDLGDNESSYKSTENGIHSIILNNGVFNSQIINNLSELKNIIDKELVILAINNNISNDIKEFLLSKNSKLNYTNDLIATLIFKNDELIVEKTGVDKINYYNFFENNLGNSYSAELMNLKDKKESFIAEDNTIIQNLIFNSTNKSNLKSKDLQADAIIITHNNFIDGANKYSEYYKEFKNLNIKVINVKDIYKEFGVGKESPFSIKAFLQYAFNEWKSPKFTHLTIVGDASWDPIKRNPKFTSNSWVPVYGWPTTDIWYGTLDGNNDYGLDIAVGRIPVNTNEEMVDYVHKLKEYNGYKTKKWMTNFINLTGGYNENNEKEKFYNGREAWMETFSIYNLCLNEKVIRKKEGVIVGNSQGGEIRDAINNGAFWVSYFGHASANNFDMDGWDVTTLNNKGKLTILSSLSCNTGAFAEPEFKYGRSEQYLLNPDRGFVGILASTFTGLGELVKGMQRSLFFDVARDEVRERNLGMLLEYSKSNLTLPDNGKIESTPYIDAFYHNILLGDPLLDIKIGKGIDLFFDDDIVNITNIEGNDFLSEEYDTVYIKKEFYNNGYKLNDSIKIKISHTYNNITNEYIKLFSEICLNDSLKFELFTKNQPGTHNVKIHLNYDESIEETDFENNTLEFQFNIFQKSLLPIEPLNNWSVKTDNPEFIFINPFVGNYKYEAKIIELNIDNNIILENNIYNSKFEDFSILENRVVFRPNIKLGEKYYKFVVKFLDSNGVNLPNSSLLSINFNTFSEINDDNITFNFNDNFSLSKGNFDNTILKDNKIILSGNEYKFEIISSRGNPQDPDLLTKRYIKIQYTQPDGKEVVFQDGINTGFHTFSFPALYNDNTPNAIYFDTWGLQSVEQGLDATLKFVNYLKDSIKDDEYFFIANCDEGARIPKEFCFDKPCFLDSIKVLFNELGSKTGEKYDWGYTFAYALKKEGNKIIVINDSCELYNRITMTGSMHKGFKEGKYKIKTNSRAKKFKNITFETDIENPEVELKLIDKFDKVIEYRNENKFIKVDNNKYESSEDLIDFINDSIIDFVDLEFKLARNKSYENYYISNLKTEFEAIDELALIKSKISLDSNNYLRGYKANLNLFVENLSNRFYSDDFKIKISLVNNSGTTDFFIDVKGLERNSTKEINFEIPTEFLSSTNDINIEIVDNKSNNRNNDLYQFNNIHIVKLYVKEDNIKPTVKVYFNEKVLKNRDFVSQNPYFKIELEDNSPLNFNNTQIQVFLNSNFISQNNTLTYIYENLKDDKIKSFFEFQWNQNLDFGENLLSVRAFDRAGNSDTLELSVFVSRDGFINNVLCYPNPTSNGTKIQFNILMPLNKVDASIYIYDAVGNFVNKIDKEVIVGQNEIEWDLKNSFGNTVSGGKYFYFIKINSPLYFEDVSGSILIVN